MNFKKLQKEILSRGISHDACDGGLTMVKNSKSKLDLLSAIKRHWVWCFENEEIIDDNFILENFSDDEIRESEFYFMKDKVEYATFTKTLLIPTDGWTEILVGNQPFLIANKNLKNEELTLAIHPNIGEHYFDWDGAMKASSFIKASLFTSDEYVLFCDSMSVFDKERSGRWFRLKTPSAGIADVFLPAAGLRGNNSGYFLYVGSYGFYWSASPYTAANNYAGSLAFGTGSLTVANNNARAHGFSVRCVKRI